MLDNANYNIVEELAEKSNGAWRMDQYIHEAHKLNCPSCEQMWRKIKMDDEEHIKMLEQEIANHVTANVFA